MTPKTLVSMIRLVGKMTQEQVAIASGLPQSMISKIEREKVTDIMSKSYLALLSLFHEVSGTSVSSASKSKAKR